MENEKQQKEMKPEDCVEGSEPEILDEINIEELAVDGICGIY